MTASQRTYRDYRNTDHWKKVSAAVKKRADYKCQVCNSPHDLQAHHRTYVHLHKEMDFLDDVTCLCRHCHELFHGKFDAQSLPLATALPEAMTADSHIGLFLALNKEAGKHGIDTFSIYSTGGIPTNYMPTAVVDHWNCLTVRERLMVFVTRSLNKEPSVNCPRLKHDAA